MSSELNQGSTTPRSDRTGVPQGLLSAQNKKSLPNIYIATYNVSSISDQTRLTNLEQELMNIKWDVIGEIENVINTMKKGKASDPDITIDPIKGDGTIIHQ